MSDKEMWPNEKDKGSQWEAPSGNPPASDGETGRTAEGRTPVDRPEALGADGPRADADRPPVPGSQHPAWPGYGQQQPGYGQQGPGYGQQGPAYGPSQLPQAGPSQPYGQGHQGMPTGHEGSAPQHYGPAQQPYRRDEAPGAGPAYGPPLYGSEHYGQPTPGGASYGNAPWTGQHTASERPGPPGPPGHNPPGAPPYSPNPYPYDPKSYDPSYGRPSAPSYGPHAPYPYGGPPSYGPPPPPPYNYGAAASPGAPRGNSRRALQSAAAVLVIAAAAVAGAGISHAIWPSAQPASSASPIATAPSNGNVPSGLLPNGFTNPFGIGSPGATTPTTSGEGAGGPSDVSAIAAKVDPALVDVNVIFNYQQAEGAGTGIVLTPNGLVLTNNHVIDEETKISVTDVGNGRTYAASVVGYDNTHDVALLQLQGASGLTTAKIATSPPSIGEAVVAIGNAGGTGGTPTSAGGSITALDQSITASDALTHSNEQLSGLIEVNANVESGDSGGPLVNTAGDVLGMDTAASSGFSFASQGNEGFAIPITRALNIARVIESGKGNSVVHVGPTAFLGVLLQEPSTSTPISAPASNNASNSGLDVDEAIPGAPAAAAGLSAGDTITSFNGTSVTTQKQLTHLLVSYHPGDKVRVGWTTPTGQSRSAEVTLGSGPPS